LLELFDRTSVLGAVQAGVVLAVLGAHTGEFDPANVGSRDSTEVARVDVHSPRGPKKVLRVFRRIAIDLAIGALAHYDAQAKGKVVDAGRYEVMVGASSADSSRERDLRRNTMRSPIMRRIAVVDRALRRRLAQSG
jgi:hypothetical protein